MLNRKVHQNRSHSFWPNQLIPANRGQSLVEVIVALAVFALMAAAMATLVVGSYIALGRGGEQIQAGVIAEEGMEAVRAIRDRAWNELIYSPARVYMSGGQWELGSAVSDLIDGKYTRVITLADVCRDVGGNIIICSFPLGTVDAHTKLVTVTVTWSVAPGVTNSAQREAYLTNWDSREWTQTDWSGGGGQAVWSDATKYSNASDVDVATAGEVKLARESGNWVPHGGQNFVDTTDVDFNQGTYSGTAVSCAGGCDASVVLGKSFSWVEHPDSRVATTAALNDLSVVSDTNVWAVGDSGVILNYNGTNWSRINSGTAYNLNGIHMLSSTDGWAVGARGRILRYQNGSWGGVASPISSDLNDVYMVSPTRGWAVGSVGKILYYNGSSWSIQANLGSRVWRSVHIIPDGANWQGWAVGNAGRIRRYKNGNWNQEYDLGNMTWRRVQGFTSNDAWVVGDSGNIRRWNGASWLTVGSTVNTDLYGLHMLSSSDGWAVGIVGRILHYDGAWSLHTDTGANIWRAVQFTPAGVGWVVGNGGRIYEYANFYNSSGTFISRELDSGSDTTVWNSLYWAEVLSNGATITIATRTRTAAGAWSAFSSELTNSSGSTITSPPGRYLQYRATLNRGSVGTATPALAEITIFYNTPAIDDLDDISIVAPNNIWAAGNNGTIIRYDGTSWQDVNFPFNTDLKGIYMFPVSDMDGWAVGASGKVFRWNGVTWGETDTGNQTWNDIQMLSRTDGWIVGSGGEIRRWNGSAWNIVFSPVSTTLNDVQMLSPSEGWAVGTGGKILHYNGAWSEVFDTGSHTWNAVNIVSASDGWIVGNAGNIYRYGGGSFNNWSSFSSPVNNNLNGLVMVNSNDGWAVGNGGTILRWAGAVWADTLSPTANALQDAVMVSATDGWAVGSRGTIIRFTQNALFRASGWLESSAFDIGQPAKIQVVDWDEIIPACAPACSVLLRLRGAPFLAGPWTGWYDFTAANGTLVPVALNNNRWLQYRLELSGDTTNTPVFAESRINYRN